MRNLFLIVAALLALSSCRVTRDRCNQLYPPVTDTSSHTTLVVTTKIDTVTLSLPADTGAFMRLLFECDSTGKAIVKSLQQQTGQRSSLQVNTLSTNRATTATVRCKCDSVGIYHLLQTTDTLDRQQQTITKTVQVPVPAQLTWWQQFKIDYGGYAIGLIALYLLLRLGWWALRTYTSIQLPGASVISKIL